MIEVARSLGGVLTLDDLAMHQSTLTDPISIDYARRRLWECAPNGQDKPTVPTKYTHYLIQALRFAFADAQAWIADPAVLPPRHTIAALLSPAVLDVRARQLIADTPDLNPTPVVFPPGGTPRFSSDTVYSPLVPKGVGCSLQNRGVNFDLDANSINVVAPHKRPYHTIIPAMITTPGHRARLIAAFGVQGGFNQPQGHVQVLLQYLAGKLTGVKDAESALDAPRLCLQPEEVVEDDGGQKMVAPVDVEDGC
ncbi:hypothetical protein AMAG_06182 [Allomyces macrogynus ATCC 38327]|uniref:Uncharacterized protein n=1 Tax=Allomyces macrogynus (strain ATCC 38327) TaxID=578462 RepID=A0A0L0SFQ8_ALLM3|nr:hypothetical protein AMAG_06182 [Allomyces macrogynus ATCC 38327]|eukprot:KNE61353.1 hypothetical protein AMAG_06182 [Allomyces macrogynus ATCC 38327]